MALTDLLKNIVSVIALSTIACASSKPYAPSPINGNVDSYLMINNQKVGPIASKSFNYNPSECTRCEITKDVTFKDSYGLDVSTKQTHYMMICEGKDSPKVVFTGEQVYRENRVEYNTQTVALPSGDAVQFNLKNPKSKPTHLDKMPEASCPK